MDGCEQVRVCAVKGTAKILDSLWEVRYPETNL